ncbi:WD repeat-containing protein 19 isoform X2 [Bemisia tabaci]
MGGVVIGGKNLSLFSIKDPSNLMELMFQTRYGSIVDYHWYCSGCILLGFSNGFFVAISTHQEEIGQELFQIQNHYGTLGGIAYCPEVGKVATCGDNNIKIHEASNFQEVSAVMSVEREISIENIAWTDDGQLLTAAGASGSVYVFLSRLPQLAGVSSEFIATLSSLKSISLYLCKYENMKVKTIKKASFNIEIEPNFVTCSNSHIVLGMNNRCWIYEVGKLNDYEENMKPVLKRHKEYLGSIHSISVSNHYISVLFEGKLHIHKIEESPHGSEMKILPEIDQELVIVHHEIIGDFLYYSSDIGHIRCFNLEDWKNVSNYQHPVAIKTLMPNINGNRIAFIDDKGNGFILNAMTDTVLAIPSVSSGSTKILWDNFRQEVGEIFIIGDSNSISTYVYVKDTINGAEISKISSTKLSQNFLPLILHNGGLTLLSGGGKLTNLILNSHLFSHTVLKQNRTDGLESVLARYLALYRCCDALNVCHLINKKECWAQLAATALRCLDINTAIKVYMHLGDDGMVLSLQAINAHENKKFFAGQIAMFLQDFDKAEEYFLNSDEPTAALDMRIDILHWDSALQLANTLAPEMLPFISKEYAFQLEFSGQYVQALSYYEKALSDFNCDFDLKKYGSFSKSFDHTEKCNEGIARTAIRVGNFELGFRIAMSSMSNRSLKMDCAEILEAAKKHQYAAILYEAADNFDKAAICLANLKQWDKIEAFLSRISSAKIYIMYAKAKESAGEYEKAVRAYELAHDYNNVIRLDLEHLNDPENAVKLVQETHSLEGAKLVAKFFQTQGNITSAIRFLIVSQCYKEAFQIARANNQLELYGEILTAEGDDDKISDEYHSLAVTFESQNQYFLAGKYYFLCKDYPKAFKLLIQAAKNDSKNPESLSYAIEVVSRTDSNAMSNQLINLLLGHLDGIPRDPRNIYRLYLARSQFKEATETAIIIADNERVNGNYRSARDVLFSICQELRLNGLKISFELLKCLHLLHSYALIKIHVRRNDHHNAALLLMKVADNISKFPSHTVQILTSAVIECQRADFKADALQFASYLMKPENRQLIDPKYRSKIEGIVRKANRSTPKKAENISTPCPYCNFNVPQTQLECPQCSRIIPFCIASGYHIVLDELTACPLCNFPAKHVTFTEVLESYGKCPMCQGAVNALDLVLSNELRQFAFFKNTT